MRPPAVTADHSSHLHPVFSLSAFVIGPAISGTAEDVTPGPLPTVDHTGNHTGGH